MGKKCCLLFSFIILISTVLTYFLIDYNDILNILVDINEKIDTPIDFKILSDPPNSTFTDPHSFINSNNNPSHQGRIDGENELIRKDFENSVIKKIHNTTEKINKTQSDSSEKNKNSDNRCFLKNFVMFLINNKFTIIVNNFVGKENPLHDYEKLDVNDSVCDETQTPSDTNSNVLPDNYKKFTFNKTNIFNFLPIESLNISNIDYLSIHGEHQYQEIDFLSILKIQKIMKKKFIKKIIINDIIDDEIKQTLLDSSVCYSSVKEDSNKENIIYLYRKDNMKLIIESKIMHLYYPKVNQNFGDRRDISLVLTNFKLCVFSENEENNQENFIQNDNTYICCHIIAYLKTFFEIIYKDYLEKNKDTFEIVLKDHLNLCQDDPNKYSIEQLNILKIILKSLTIN